MLKPAQDKGWNCSWILTQGSIYNGTVSMSPVMAGLIHDDVIKWKYFPRNWPFVRGIHRSPVNSPQHKGQGREALMFSLICAQINGWVNNCEAGELWRYRAHCDVIVMSPKPEALLVLRINCNPRYINTCPEKITYLYYTLKVEFGEWISDFIQHVIMDLITYAC